MMGIQQQGYSLISMVLLLQMFSLLLLNSLNQRLSEQLRLYNDERAYFRVKNQALSSLNWGVGQKWTKPSGHWLCLQHITHHLKACLKLSSQPNKALLVGYSHLLLNNEPIRFYQWVLLPVDWQERESLFLIKQPRGWLDFCPEANEDMCL